MALVRTEQKRGREDQATVYSEGVGGGSPSGQEDLQFQNRTNIKIIRLRKLFGDPKTLRKVHGYAAVFWTLMVIPSVLWLRSSVPYLVLLSVYAVITGHWSSWQSSRVEVVQYEDASVQEVLDEMKK